MTPIDLLFGILVILQLAGLLGCMFIVRPITRAARCRLLTFTRAELGEMERLTTESAAEHAQLMAVSGALVDASSVIVEPYADAVRALVAERDDARAERDKALTGDPCGWCCAELVRAQRQRDDERASVANMAAEVDRLREELKSASQEGVVIVGIAPADDGHQEPALIPVDVHVAVGPEAVDEVIAGALAKAKTQAGGAAPYPGDAVSADTSRGAGVPAEPPHSLEPKPVAEEPKRVGRWPDNPDPGRVNWWERTCCGSTWLTVENASECLTCGAVWHRPEAT